ncbi:glyoxalase/bleomycin resistance/extradiol dioxygenase family protein [Streptomyces carminius]|uniref:Glyoxalase/bleomycin resistance/extradiol dioxygenase family protein n=1 Tax=Streptomyces carminius TaxID=2665496 RepID=A0A2M8LSQ6_9ACTN|nr:VOC family protein [Streptomyces carminius]PJE94984.1 glyoxalase/bleomycin resistance/extradiol dioxygenase family protein [Streptomyces carminius]
MTETTTPILPCRTLPPVLGFYAALGFETTFEQRSPNPYAVVARGGIELHFFGMKRYDPARSYSTCHIATDDVDALYAAFRAGLKESYGKVPSRGLPRIGPVKDMPCGTRQFLVSDPGGNCLRIGQRTGGDLRHPPAPRERFARVLQSATLLADSRQDPETAARILDRALAADGAGAAEGAAGRGTVPAQRPTPVQLLRLLVLRGDLARRLGAPEREAALLKRASADGLTADEREAVRDDLARPAELRE